MIKTGEPIIELKLIPLNFKGKGVFEKLYIWAKSKEHSLTFITKNLGFSSTLALPYILGKIGIVKKRRSVSFPQKIAKSFNFGKIQWVYFLFRLEIKYILPLEATDTRSQSRTMLKFVGRENLHKDRKIY